MRFIPKSAIAVQSRAYVCPKRFKKSGPLKAI
jgi:hypothetical protein